MKVITTKQGDLAVYDKGKMVLAPLFAAEIYKRTSILYNKPIEIIEEDFLITVKHLFNLIK